MYKITFEVRIGLRKKPCSRQHGVPSRIF